MREELYLQLKELILEFEAKLNADDLRSQVLSLVEIVRQYRRLGISLVDPSLRQSARKRILLYFRKHIGVPIHGDELMVVSGIQEYARRIRELKVDFGWQIVSGSVIKQMMESGELSGYEEHDIQRDTYVLLSDVQDRESAFRYNQMKEIRHKYGLSARDRILESLRQNVDAAVTGEELSYVSKIKDWPRRVRELRTEYGWPIMTKSTGRPDLPIGCYILVEDRQDEEHDRNISTDIRIAVLDRDRHRCVVCGWPENRSEHDKYRNGLELHHIEHHARGGSNAAENLVTLCNVHHDAVHRIDKDGNMNREEFYAWAAKASN